MKITMTVQEVERALLVSRMVRDLITLGRTHDEAIRDVIKILAHEPRK